MINLSPTPHDLDIMDRCAKTGPSRGNANISETSCFPKDFLILLPLQTAVSTRGRGRGAVRTTPQAATAQPPVCPVPSRGGDS